MVIRLAALVMGLWDRLVELAVEPGLQVDLHRVQWEEQRQRRDSLWRELDSGDARACMTRVKQRMVEGDRVWIPPYYKKEEAHAAWKVRDWKRRVREAQAGREGA